MNFTTRTTLLGPAEPLPNGEQQAFPSVDFGPPNGGVSPGLTKREYFAGLALQGLLASGQGGNERNLAKKAFRYADELLLAELGDE